MIDHDQRSKCEERRRHVAEVRERLAVAKMAHTMTDEESQQALIVLDLEDVQERLEKRLINLWDEDAVGMAVFGESYAWVDKRLGDERG
jgi:hypothetical protein